MNDETTTPTPVPTTMDIHEILRRLPHRYPILLVDRVVELIKGERIRAIKNVSINEPFFLGHFPHRPVMPGVLVLEALAQAATLLAIESVGIVPTAQPNRETRTAAQVCAEVNRILDSYDHSDADEPVWVKPRIDKIKVGIYKRLEGYARTVDDAHALDLRTWAIDVPDDDFVEISYDDAWVADDYAACQELADTLRASGRAGAIVPSAALPGTRNVVLFGGRVTSPWLAREVRPLEARASITGEHGAALAALTRVARFRGMPHPGADFEFAEPDWSYA